MITNDKGQELISENTTGSIDRNSRPRNFTTPKNTNFIPRISIDSVTGQVHTYRTYVGDGSGYGNLGSTWYHPYVGTLTVDQRQELTSAININAALTRKRWTYS